MTTTLFGMPIYENTLLTELVNVARSPSRALRRWRQGKRATNPMQPRPSTKAFLIDGKVLVMHPEMRNRLVRDLPAREPTAIGFDMATEPDRTVVAELVRQSGKIVLRSKPGLADFIDNVLAGDGMRLAHWQRRVVTAIEQAPKPLAFPPLPHRSSARLRAMFADTQASIERQLLGVVDEPLEARVLDAAMVRRMLNGDWGGKPEDPRDRQTTSPVLLPTSPCKEQC